MDRFNMKTLKLIGSIAFLCGFVGETINIAYFSLDYLGVFLLMGGISLLSLGVYQFFKRSSHRTTSFKLGFVFIVFACIIDIALSVYNGYVKEIVLDILFFILGGFLMFCVVEATAKTQVLVAFFMVFTGIFRIFLFVSARGISELDYIFGVLIFIGIIAGILNLITIPHVKEKKIEEATETAVLEENPAIEDTIIVDEEIKANEPDLTQIQSVPVKKKKMVDEEPITHVVDEKTEGEVKVFKRVDRCIVCNAHLKGETYICPNCETKYCLRCAIALSKMDEHCWTCKNPIDLEQDQAQVN